MIKREFYMKRKDGVRLYKTYSDAGVKVLQIETGSVYDCAIDVEDANYTYEETKTKREEVGANDSADK